MTLLSDFTAITGILISLILIILLVKSKNRGLNQHILIIIFSFIFFASLHTYASLHKLSALYYVSFLFDYNLLWTLGPLLLLYIKSLFLDNDKLLHKNILHFLPSIFFTILVFIPKMTNQIFAETPLNYLKSYQENQLAFIVLRNIYFIVYLFLSIKLFLNLKQTLHKKLNFSIEEYNWIHKLFLGSLGFVSVDILIRSFELFAFKLQFDGGYISIFSMVIFISYLGYHGVNESRVLIPAFVLQKSQHIALHFTPKETILLEQKIKDMLEKDKLYLDERLSLKRVSESLDISDKKLSAFLNNHLNTKFKDYINFYRVEEVKEKLKSNEFDKFTLVAIANECGFNSKASFYRIFKKHTGYSPSEYKKSIN